MLKRKQAKVLARVGAQPYVSPAELAQWPDVNANTIHYYLDGLESEGYVGCTQFGWIRDSQKRYFPRGRGLRALRREYGREFSFAVSTDNVARILNFGPRLEALYYVGTRAWCPDHVTQEPERTYAADHPDGNGVPFFMLDDVEPIQFYWMPDGPVHAVMEYREPSSQLDFFMPLIWYGRHAPPCKLPAVRQELLLEFAKKYGLDRCPVPPGVCVVAADELALTRALREIPSELPLMGLAVGDGSSGKFGITFLFTMANPIHPTSLPFSHYTDEEDLYRSLSNG